MTNQSNNPASVAAVKFKWQKADDGKTYDYFIPAGLQLAVGDRALVETKRGETEVVIIEIKDASDKAEKSILRRAEPAIEPAVKAEGWNF